MKKATMINDLLTFPGDTCDPIEVITAILGWANTADQATYKRMVDWIMSKYDDFSLSTARAYVQMLVKLNLLEGIRGGFFRLTLRAKTMVAEPRDRLRLLSDQFLRRCVGMEEILSEFYSWEELYKSDIVASMETRFPKWQEGTYLEDRLYWLQLLKCIVLIPDKIERLRITQFGEGVYANHLAHREVVKSSANNVAPLQYVPTHVDTSKNSPLAVQLITELQKASIDSQSPRRMELAVAQIFRFLGFQTRHLGRSGEGDVLITANMGSRSYRVMADAKSRQDGKLKSLDADTLENHRIKENADYTLVVAQAFSGPKVADTAERYGIILLTVNTLIRWIQFHDGSPLTPDIYRFIFSQPGIRYDIPTEFAQIIEERKRFMQLLTDVIETIQEAYQHGLTYSLSSSQLLPLLIMRQRGKFYTEDEVQQALDLLAYPGIHGIVDDSMMQIDLVLNRPTLVKTFHLMANQISKMEHKIAAD